MRRHSKGFPERTAISFRIMNDDSSRFKRLNSGSPSAWRYAEFSTSSRGSATRRQISPQRRFERWLRMSAAAAERLWSVRTTLFKIGAIDDSWGTFSAVLRKITILKIVSLSWRYKMVILSCILNILLKSILTKRKILFENTFHEILFVRCVSYSTRIISQPFMKSIIAFVMSN